MNVITAIVVGLLILLAFYTLYYVVTSNNINDMKRRIRADIKTLYLEEVFELFAEWVICSALVFVVINACGLLIGFFIDIDVNFFELFFDVMMFDPMLFDPLTQSNLTTSS